jgi:hypothetical protein
VAVERAGRRELDDLRLDVELHETHLAKAVLDGLRAAAPRAIEEVGSHYRLLTPDPGSPGTKRR